MPNENENENAQIANLFEQLEKWYKRKPDVFAFFCKKYETILYDNFDWAYALFHSNEKPAGVLDKYLPYISAAFSLIILIVLFVKK